MQFLFGEYPLAFMFNSFLTNAQKRLSVALWSSKSAWAWATILRYSRKHFTIFRFQGISLGTGLQSSP